MSLPELPVLLGAFLVPADTRLSAAGNSPAREAVIHGGVVMWK
jgi:hypothetical protein